MYFARADLKCILLVASPRLCTLVYMCAPSTHVGNLHTKTPHTAETLKQRPIPQNLTKVPDLKLHPPLHCASLERPAKFWPTPTYGFVRYMESYRIIAILGTT